MKYRRIAPQKLLHSCEKPIPLLEDLITELSNEGDVILDCFMGSGSTCVACVKTGRHYIGYELDPEYYDIACKRLDEVESPDYIDPEILAYTD